MKKYTHSSKATLEEGLSVLLEKSQNHSLSIQQILKILQGRGRLLLLILLSLPFCQPIQIPGFSVPFGLVIAFIGFRLGFSHKILLPKSILNKKISPLTLKKIVRKSLWLIGKMKRWLHPRLKKICLKPIMHKVNGLLLAVLGLLLALPLPIPLSNIAAGWAILLISLGLLEDDGLFVCFGYIISLFCIGFFVFLFFSVKFFT